LELLRAAGPLRMVIFASLLTASVIFLPGGVISLAARRLRLGGVEDSRATS